MALINCPECNNLISDKSKVCIKCGFPIEEYVQENKQEEVSDKDDADKLKEIYWCRRCYRQNEVGEDYCVYCGSRLTPYYEREELTINKGELPNSDNKRCCPRCKGTNYHAFVEEVVIREGKVKGKLTHNLNPLKPFTVFNYKEKVVRKPVTKQVSKFVCDDCGEIFK